MRKACSLVVLLCLAGSVFAGARDVGQPARFVPQMDGLPVQLMNPVDGALWAAWTYRNGAESDIAISSIERHGSWSEPTLLGLDDGINQVQPALAVDAFGTLYLAYSEQRTGRIVVSSRAVWDSAWTTPVAVASGGAAPSLRVVGSTLVLAHRAGLTTHILELPLRSLAMEGTTSDGPDPVGTVWPGIRTEQDKDNTANEEDEQPATLHMNTGWGHQRTIE